MSPDADVLALVLELLHPWPEVHGRRMFGGHGIFREGLMFALIAEGQLYLKTDAALRERFSEKGLPPFTYDRGGKEASLGYHLCPEEAFETVEKMRAWAEPSWDLAVKRDEAKPPSKRKRVLT